MAGEGLKSGTVDPWQSHFQYAWNKTHGNHGAQWHLVEPWFTQTSPSMNTAELQGWPGRMCSASQALQFHEVTWLHINPQPSILTLSNSPMLGARLINHPTSIY